MSTYRGSSQCDLWHVVSRWQSDFFGSTRDVQRCNHRQNKTNEFHYYQVTKYSTSDQPKSDWEELPVENSQVADGHNGLFTSARVYSQYNDDD